MKYDRKAIMKKAWEIKKENEKNIFGLCLKMAWAIAKKEAGAEELPELQGSVKQVAWAKDIREKMIAKLDVDNLLTERGDLDMNTVDDMENLMGLSFLGCTGSYREKTDWAKKLHAKKEYLFDEFRKSYPKLPKKGQPGRDEYIAMRKHTDRLYVEYVHDLGLQFVSSLTKATDFIDRRRYV